MNYLNEAHLVGFVGQVMTDLNSVTFSLCVNTTYNGADGPIIQSDWFCCRHRAFDVPEIHSKDRVEVVGRIRHESYIRADGLEVSNYVIIADTIKVL
jgi:hypothetical protein